MARRGGWRILGLAVLHAALAVVSASAEPPCSAAKPGALLAEAIGLEADASLPAGVLDAALASWRGCPNAGTGFPAFAAAARGRSVVRVRYVAANSQEGRCGYFAGAEIVLFASARDRYGRAVPCGSLATNLAHELGHVLGLVDAPAISRCRQYVMSGDDSRPGRERWVQPEECVAADARWLTPAEGAVLAHSWQRVEGANALWLAADLETASVAATAAPAVAVAPAARQTLAPAAPWLEPDAFR